MRKERSKEAWFQAAIDKRYVSAHIRSVVEPGFEIFKEVDDAYTIRRKRRFINPATK